MNSLIELQTRVFLLPEILKVVDDLRAKRTSTTGVHSESHFRNLAVFRLATCCGMRCKEIQHSQLRDFHFAGERPYVQVRKEATKGPNPRPRKIPLWWDHGTKFDLEDFWNYRMLQTNDNPTAYFIMHPYQRDQTKIVERKKMYRRFMNAIRCLGEERCKQLSPHSGRHSFCSHMLNIGHSAAAVRDAAGHCNISITNTYLHALDNGTLPDAFANDDDDWTK